MWLLSKCSFLGLNQNGQDCFLAGWLVGWAWVPPPLLLRANMTHTQRHAHTHIGELSQCSTRGTSEGSFYWFTSDLFDRLIKQCPLWSVFHVPGLPDTLI